VAVLVVMGEISLEYPFAKRFESLTALCIIIVIERRHARNWWYTAAGFTHASILENKAYAEDATEAGTEAESNPTHSNDEISEASATNISDDEGDD